ncbi:F-box/FBD/LRR-repeat protein At1g51370-like [Panicum virgatum]|uniref:F-box domain-containing protein n=1 Tax=Panicum virgatum TaxID=38727 RepID=A0A8T0QAN1_PANVG|nr:F-box/FBD/LRR-repeat protein At1g51370-like [Panicum virgatum]KAG2570960.1 hypothetical protein PVAP13_7KG026500 [Panicum virgatum]
MAHQNPAPFVYLDAAAAADARRRGTDPHVLEQSTQDVLKYIYTCLPNAPVYTRAALSALPASSGDADDRISALPFGILRNIVSRLPAKDAARTAALSRRWRPVSRCTPLALADAHHLPGLLEGRLRHPARADTPALAATVSRAVAAHPGPSRAVHLVCGYYADAARQRDLARWFQTFAAKGVAELVLVNRPWPLDVPLPAALLEVATLTRLYLGLWKFPGTSALPHPNRGAAAVFPHLRELVLCSMEVESRDMEYLLAGSPVLENLGIVGARKNVTHLRLVGQHLRCVQICLSAIDSVAVVDTPSLERLFLWETMVLDGSCARLRIGKAPKLRVLGYLNPGIHMLEIRNTVINAGIKASPSTMVPGIKILGLNVRFGVRNDVKMLPTFLRCFPNVETLHFVSQKTEVVDGKVNLKFWQEAGPIGSIQSCIKMMTFREFRMERSEVAFLKFFFQSAQVLNVSRNSLRRPDGTPANSHNSPVK